MLGRIVMVVGVLVGVAGIALAATIVWALLTGVFDCPCQR